MEFLQKGKYTPGILMIIYTLRFYAPYTPSNSPEVLGYIRILAK
jgi:hypothetical protein